MAGIRVVGYGADLWQQPDARVASSCLQHPMQFISRIEVVTHQRNTD